MSISDQIDTLQQQTREILQATLDEYDAGLMVTDVSFQNVAPPQEVKDAFDDVNAANKRGVSLGGKVMKDTQEVPNLGWFSIILDPTGAALGLWQVNPSAPRP